MEKKDNISTNGEEVTVYLHGEGGSGENHNS